MTAKQPDLVEELQGLIAAIGRLESHLVAPVGPLEPTGPLAGVVRGILSQATLRMLQELDAQGQLPEGGIELTDQDRKMLDEARAAAEARGRRNRERPAGDGGTNKP